MTAFPTCKADPPPRNFCSNLQSRPTTHVMPALETSYICGRAGMVKSVRGVAYALRVAPAAANRMVDGSRGVLNELLADVRVFTDHRSGAEAGASPGYGLTLVAQTTTGRLISAQAVAPPAAKVKRFLSLRQVFQQVILNQLCNPLILSNQMTSRWGKSVT